jgi:hypothetical protein
MPDDVLQELNLFGGRSEPRFPKAVRIIMGYIRECHRQAIVENLCPQRARMILGDEPKEMIAEFAFLRGCVEFGRGKIGRLQFWNLERSGNCPWEHGMGLR